MYPLGDVSGDVMGAEDMTGAADMMNGVKGTTGAESTKNGIRSEVST